MEKQGNGKSENLNWEIGRGKMANEEMGKGEMVNEEMGKEIHRNYSIYFQKIIGVVVKANTLHLFEKYK